MKDLSARLMNSLGLAYWVEITTQVPRCIYYFGPFALQNSAKAAIAGYVEDLEAEGAQGIAVQVTRCKPDNLTVFDESEEVAQSNRPFSIASSQA